VFIAMSGDRRQDRGPAPTTVAATQQDSALEAAVDAPRP
jgi:hypothetical protein